MRCLQCGKDVPLLKRLAGNEFCSDAHRREYQQEYSQLALRRLQQSHPSESEKKLVEAERSATAPPPPQAPLPPLAPARIERPALASANAASKPIRVPSRPQPAPEKRISQEPAFAAPAIVQKPLPVALQTGELLTAELERALPVLAPDRPSHHTSMSPAVLVHAGSLRWESALHITDAPVRPKERTLELRESTRTTPIFDLELGIAGPVSLGLQDQPLNVAVPSGIAPAEATLWTARHTDFTNPAVSFGDFVNFQLLPDGIQDGGTVGDAEPPASLAGPGGSIAAMADIGSPLEEVRPRDEPVALGSPEVTGVVRSESAHAAVAVCRALEAPAPQAVLKPLAVTIQAIPVAKSKPVQVFGAAPFAAGTAQVPLPSALPLRPLMVLMAASRELDADLSVPRLQSSARLATSSMRTIIAVVAGVAALATGVFLFMGDQAGRGSKQVVEASTSSNQWIPDFAADAKLQRKVSVLRSSMGLPDYRVEFEGSVQIKGLGWVYRAQDSKNFYVNTIELERPGQNPTFVIAHHAVINGVDQPRMETPLHVAVPLGGNYKIRFEAAGDRFITWVQDQKMDEWTDARLKTGGAGLYREGAEQFTLHGDFRVTPLPTAK